MSLHAAPHPHPLDVAADALLGPVPPGPTPTIVGQVIGTAVRRLSVAVVIEVFGDDTQRAALHRVLSHEMRR